jgi:hypothetical protein
LTKKGANFNVRGLPPGGKIRLVPNEHPSSIDVAGEMPTIAVGAVIKLSHLNSHAHRSCLYAQLTRTMWL